MTVKESWSGDKTRVKVGDVLERSISREVSGTVSELIPPINWDSLPGVSLYPTRSEARKNYLKGEPQTEGGGHSLWIHP
jgi:hypothetical protein